MSQVLFTSVKALTLWFDFVGKVCHKLLTSCSTFVIFTKNWVTLGANIPQKENMPVLEC